MNNYHKKTIKIITQSLKIDILEPFKLKDTTTGVCTGFFISPSLILTCSHCVVDSKHLYFEVPYKGKKKLKMTLLGVCPKFDIALLKSDEYKSSHYFSLGNSNKIKAGYEVYAVGFPLGQSNLKITKGIISGIQFSSIQIDAPINPGNSGGPLIYNGKVIGINKSGFRHTNNIGYAAPIECYNVIKKELNSNKSILIHRPEMGFSYINSTKGMLELSKSKKNGVYICDIFKNSPISKTGLKRGDILTKINDNNIDNYGLIKSLISKNDKIPSLDIFNTFKINQKVKIEYIRDGKIYKKSYNYSDYIMPIREIYSQFDEIEYISFGGIVFMDLLLNHLDIINIKEQNIKLPISLLEYYKNDNREKQKIIITVIYPNTYIENIDVLSVGDIIIKCNNKSISNIKELKKVMKNPIKKGKSKYMSIETEDNKKIIIDLEKILSSEKNTANTFKYPIMNIL